MIGEGRREKKRDLGRGQAHHIVAQEGGLEKRSGQRTMSSTEKRLRERTSWGEADGMEKGRRSEGRAIGGRKELGTGGKVAHEGQTKNGAHTGVDGSQMREEKRESAY